MDSRRTLIWRGAQPMIGTVVGVGIFGLPYVFAQAGYVYGLLELIIVAALSLLTFFIYADLLSINKAHSRFVEVVGHQLGPLGKFMATLAFFGSLWGGMLAYVIVGGGFLSNILQPVLGGAVTQYQVAFWVIASACMVGGSLFVRRVQAVIIPIFFVMITALVVFSLPHLEIRHLTAFQATNILLPFGPLLFALSGFAAVPEARDALGRNKVALIRPTLLLAVTLIAVLYALFTVAIVGMTGPFTSPQAVEGLRFVAGPWLMMFVSCIGLCTVFMAYISVGVSLTNSLIYDFRGRFLSSWWLVVAVPISLFFLGARNFIDVIGTTGGLLGGLSGIVLVLAYERARLTAQLPKRALAVPQGLVAITFILFAAMILITLTT